MDTKDIVIIGAIGLGAIWLLRESAGTGGGGAGGGGSASQTGGVLGKTLGKFIPALGGASNPSATQNISATPPVNWSPSQAIPAGVTISGTSSLGATSVVTTLTPQVSMPSTGLQQQWLNVSSSQYGWKNMPVNATAYAGTTGVAQGMANALTYGSSPTQINQIAGGGAYITGGSTTIGGVNEFLPNGQLNPDFLALLSASQKV